MAAKPANHRGGQRPAVRDRSDNARRHTGARPRRGTAKRETPSSRKATCAA